MNEEHRELMGLLTATVERRCKGHQPRSVAMFLRVVQQELDFIRLHHRPSSTGVNSR